MGKIFDITMFGTLIFVLILEFMIMFPKKWKEKKMILGVRNRKEFHDGEAEKETEHIFDSCRKQMLISSGMILICGAVMFLFDSLASRTFFWVILTYLGIIASSLSLIRGNREMKSLKRKIGIVSAKGVVYTDLKTAGAVHGLKPVQLIVPCVANALILVLAILLDMHLINIGNSINAGTFAGSFMTLTFFMTGVIVAVCAWMMDNLRNEVISDDSDINTNYNRAKKKVMAAFAISTLWINTIYTLCALFITLFMGSELVMIISVLIYAVLIAACLCVLFSGNMKIESRYQKEANVVADDDDHWIMGMFYYNPEDKRLNVEKRVGIGATINMAHPAGKAIAVVIALMLFSSVVSLSLVGVIEGTPMSIKTEGNMVICHQLWDAYKIPVDDIQSVELINDRSNISMFRTSGMGTDSELWGNFTVDNETGCKVFLYRHVNSMLKIKTADGLYYINSADEDEVKSCYDYIVK